MGYDLLQSKLGGPLGFLKSLRSTQASRAALFKVFRTE